MHLFSLSAVLFSSSIGTHLPFPKVLHSPSHSVLSIRDLIRILFENWTIVCTGRSNGKILSMMRSKAFRVN